MHCLVDPFIGREHLLPECPQDRGCSFSIAINVLNVINVWDKSIHKGRNLFWHPVSVIGCLSLLFWSCSGMVHPRMHPREGCLSHSSSKAEKRHGQGLNIPNNLISFNRTSLPEGFQARDHNMGGWDMSSCRELVSCLRPRIHFQKTKQKLWASGKHSTSKLQWRPRKHFQSRLRQNVSRNYPSALLKDRFVNWYNWLVKCVLRSTHTVTGENLTPVFPFPLLRAKPAVYYNLDKLQRHTWHCGCTEVLKSLCECPQLCLLSYNFFYQYQYAKPALHLVYWIKGFHCVLLLEWKTKAQILKFPIFQN